MKKACLIFLLILSCQGAFSQSTYFPDLIKRANPTVLGFYGTKSDTTMYFHFLDKAVEHMHKKEYKESMYDINKALLFDSLSPNALALRSFLYVKNEDFEKAEADLVKSRKSGINLINSYHYYYFYLARGNYLEALKNINDVINMDDSDPIFISLRGELLLWMNDTVRAFESFDEAVQKNPMDTEILKIRMQYYIVLGKKEKALNDIDKMASLDTTFNPDISKCKLYTVIGNKREAEKALERSLEKADNSPDDYFDLGCLCTEYKKYEKAVIYFDKCINSNPEETEYLRKRGNAKFLSGDKKGGCEDIRKAADMGDENAKEIMKQTCK
ncbi:MAG: hypothetical protein V2A54_00100 [Bacteroidota bacterium]